MIHGIMTLLCRNNCIKLRTCTRFVQTIREFQVHKMKWTKMDFEFMVPFGSWKCTKHVSHWMHDGLGVSHWCNLFRIDLALTWIETGKRRDRAWIYGEACWKRSWTATPLGISHSFQLPYSFTVCFAHCSLDKLDKIVLNQQPWNLPLF